MDKYKINQIITLRKSGMSYSNISKTLNVSKSVISYHCSKLLDNKEITSNNRNQFIPSSEQLALIKKLLSIRCTHFEISLVTNIEKSKITNLCKQLDVKPVLNSRYAAVKNRRKRLKLLAVIVKGGRCEQCGYNKYLSVLEFHHKDSDTKEFTISQNINRSWRKVFDEIQKCELLCANCHREKHALQNDDLIVNEFIPSE